MRGIELYGTKVAPLVRKALTEQAKRRKRRLEPLALDAEAHASRKPWMIISNDDELTKLKEIGRICANALQAMAAALEPGITTLELDAIGRKVLEDCRRAFRAGTCL